MNDIFIYGTLLNNEVLRAVVNRSFLKRTAYLPGYKRVKVMGEEFPAIYLDKASEVEGALIMGLSDRDLDRLDRYEGLYYERKSVVVLLSGDVPHHCMTYIFRPMYSKLLSNEAWCNKKFRKVYMQQYLKGVASQN